MKLWTPGKINHAIAGKNRARRFAGLCLAGLILATTLPVSAVSDEIYRQTGHLSDEAINHYIEKLESGTKEERRFSIFTIGTQRIYQGLRPMLEILERSNSGEMVIDQDIIYDICSAVGRLGDPLGNEHMIRQYDYEKKRITEIREQDKVLSKAKTPDPFFAKSALSSFTGIRHVSLAVEAEKRINTALMAIWALGRINNKNGREKLLKLALDDKEEVRFRQAAVRELGYTREPSLIPEMEKLMGDTQENPLVRAQATTALINIDIKNAKARETLREQLTAPSYEVRMLVADAVSRLKLRVLRGTIRDAIRLENHPRIRKVLSDALEESDGWQQSCCYHDNK